MTEEVSKRPRGRPTNAAIAEKVTSALTEAHGESAANAGKEIVRSRLTTAQWAEISAIYRAGEATIRELGERYGVHKDTIFAGLKKRGVKKGEAAEELAARVQEKMERTMLGEENVIATRIRETKDDHYKMATGLAKLTWNEVLTAKKSGVAFGACLNNLKALQIAAEALKVCRAERYTILGLDKESAVDADELPDLIISELTAEQIEALRNRDNQSMMEMEPADDDTVVQGDDDIVDEED